VQAQYLVIPVNIWGAIVYAVGAYLSDKYQKRFLPLVICAPFGIVGYAILLAPVSPGVRYFATYLIATACYLCTGGNMYVSPTSLLPVIPRRTSVNLVLCEQRLALRQLRPRR
jgi:MFS family permease